MNVEFMEDLGNQPCHGEEQSGEAIAGDCFGPAALAMTGGGGDGKRGVKWKITL
jgi:hypothetical protein